MKTSPARMARTWDRMPGGATAMTSDETYPEGTVPSSEIAEAAVLPYGDVHYPESDGQPMGETETHGNETWELIQALRHFLRDQPDVYVGGNLFVYYEEGNPRAVVCPDVFVARGVPKLVTRGGREEKRRTYKLWEEGRAPSMVIEVTSKSTRDEDEEEKKVKYARLGVEEYFLYDPLGEYLEPRLQGFRLLGDRYRPIQPHAAEEAAARRHAEEQAAEEATARREAEERAAEEAAARQQEAAARRKSEERAAALEAEVARLRQRQR